jgi:hypothetical protein
MFFNVHLHSAPPYRDPSQVCHSTRVSEEGIRPHTNKHGAYLSSVLTMSNFYGEPLPDSEASLTKLRLLDFATHSCYSRARQPRSGLYSPTVRIRGDGMTEA